MKPRRNRGSLVYPDLRAEVATAMVGALQEALRHAVRAGAPRAAARIRAALSSAYGAERAARGRVHRASAQQVAQGACQ